MRSAGLDVTLIPWIRNRVAEWLSVKFAHEQRGLYASPHLKAIVAAKADNEIILWEELVGIRQLVADADHSALLYRLLEGKEPLPEPPPLKHAYPDYPN